jgi:hypothetical protein
MRHFPTKYGLFFFGKVGDTLESERVLCGESALLEQLFEVTEVVRPRELCAIAHKLLVGQTRERIGELGVNVRYHVVDMDVCGDTRTILLFFISDGPCGTFLFVVIRSGHVEGRRQWRDEITRRANTRKSAVLSSMAFYMGGMDWDDAVMLGESVKEQRWFAGQSASGGAKRRVQLYFGNRLISDLGFLLS